MHESRQKGGHAKRWVRSSEEEPCAPSSSRSKVISDLGPPINLGKMRVEDVVWSFMTFHVPHGPVLHDAACYAKVSSQS